MIQLKTLTVEKMGDSNDNQCQRSVTSKLINQKVTPPGPSLVGFVVAIDTAKIDTEIKATITTRVIIKEFFTFIFLNILSHSNNS